MWGAQMVSWDWRVEIPMPGVGSKALTAEEGTHAGREFVLHTFNKAGDLCAAIPMPQGHPADSVGGMECVSLDLGVDLGVVASSPALGEEVTLN